MRLKQYDIDRIKEAMQLLDTEITTYISIPALAAKVGLSESKLTKGFLQHFGITIYKHHLKVSMDYAKEQLAKNKSVKEVALELQYATQQSFSHAFKAYFKQTPESVK